MQVISMVWGILSIFGMFIGFIPCLGALNWLNIPFSAAGLILSIVAFASGRPGHRTLSLVGIICCAAAVLLGGKRLILGGGIL